MTIFFFIIIATYTLDLLTKHLVRTSLLLGQEISLLPFFSLTRIENTGVAFGMFQGRNTFFLVLGVLVVVGILAMGLLSLKKDRFFALVLALVAGGALGNITDRIVFGRVTDFLDFFVGAIHWPAFNVADSAICVGACLLIGHSLFQMWKGDGNSSPCCTKGRQGGV